MSISNDVKEEMKNLQGEINRGIIYLHYTGFFNYDMLRHLLEQSGLLTVEMENQFRKYDSEYKVGRYSTQTIIRHGMGYLHLHELVYDGIEEADIPILTDTVEPRYDEMRPWIQWIGSLREQDANGKPSLDNGLKIVVGEDWKIGYCPSLDYILMNKGEEISITAGIYPLCKVGNFEGRYPGPVFELHPLVDLFGTGESVVIRFSRYDELRETLELQFDVKAPTFNEVSASIRHFVEE